MILTLQHKKIPILFTGLDIAHPCQHGGTTILYRGERIDVVETFNQVQMLWHESCYNSNSKIVNSNYTNNISNSNIVNDTVAGLELEIMQHKVQVDRATTITTFDYVQQNPQCQKILDTWFELYHDMFSKPLEIINRTNIGAIAGVAKRGDTDKAIEMLEWLFTSDHYRAKWLRGKNMLDPAVVLSKDKFDTYWDLCQQSVRKLSEVATTIPALPEPEFDEDGNLIGGL